MKVVLSSTLAAVVALASSSALAQQIERRFELSVDTTLFSAESGTLAPRGSDARATTSGTTIGPASGLGVGAGVGLTDSILLSARLGYASSNRTVDVASTETTPSMSSEATSSTFSLYPQIAYVLLPKATFRPYFGGIFGVTSTHTKSSGVDDQSSGIALGAAVGGHWFATESFSIDPAVSLIKTFGSEEVSSAKFDHSGVVFAASVALSGWFGSVAHPSEPPADRASLGQSDAPDPTQDRIAETLAVKVTLDRASEIRLSGDPIFDPRHLAVTLTVRKDAMELAQCSNIRFEGSSAAVKVERIERQFSIGDEPSMLLRGRLSVPELANVLDADDARLNLCGHESSVAAPERAQLGAFVDRFAQRLTDIERTAPHDGAGTQATN